jgi:hypothetical protein
LQYNGSFGGTSVHHVSPAAGGEVCPRAHTLLHLGENGGQSRNKKKILQILIKKLKYSCILNTPALTVKIVLIGLKTSLYANFVAAAPSH